MLFVKPFQPSSAFQIETSGFFMKPNTELKWVKQGRIFSLNQVLRLHILPVTYREAHCVIE